MKRTKCVVFLGLVLALVTARRSDASLLYPWSWFTDVYNCSEPSNWYPENAITTWCDCGGEPDWCGEIAEEFCGNAEGFCNDYCDWSWGYGGGTVTQCEPDLVGFVECSCGAIVN
jgi:hypothetical protein